MRTFSVLHPTARVNSWYLAYGEWLNKSSLPIEVEYVLSTHFSRLAAPVIAHDKLQLRFTSHNGRDCVVDNGNNAARWSGGAVLIGGADDLFPPQDWDMKLFELLVASYQRLPDLRKEEFFLNLLPGRCTHFALSRKLYERWGHFVYPEFVSMYSDDDAREQAEADGVTVVEAGHLGFEHRHHSVGMRVHDEVDREHASSENYRIGFEVIERRREARRKQRDQKPRG